MSWHLRCSQLAALTLHASQQQRVLFEGAMAVCMQSGVAVPAAVTFKGFKTER